MECSESPRFHARTAEDLAAELVDAQDKELELVRELSEKLAGSFGSVANISKLGSNLAAASNLTKWAEQQRRTMDAIGRSVLPPPAFTASRALTRKELATLPAFAPKLTPDFGNLLAQRVRLPEPTLRVLSESMRSALSAYSQQSASARNLSKLAGAPTFSISGVFRAAREAAALAQDQGDSEQAMAIAAVTAEVSEVVERPSLARLEQAITDIAERLEEDAENRKHERRDELVLNVYLWYLAIILAVFMYLYPR